MREIKFRAWDEDRKEMLEPQDLSQGRVYWPWLGLKDVPLMQFTGLKSKSGVDIYEGDILEEYGKGEGEPFVVKEMIPLVRFYENYPSPTKDDWMSWSEMYEVIGNIYENPELLNQN